MTYTRSNHLDKELVFERLTRQEICPCPGMLIGGDYGFAGDRVRG
jgi:succinate dehydrogenase/fumarate reductase-like Fe-S protein